MQEQTCVHEAASRGELRSEGRARTLSSEIWLDARGAALSSCADAGALPLSRRADIRCVHTFVLANRVGLARPIASLLLWSPLWAARCGLEAGEAV